MYVAKYHNYLLEASDPAHVRPGIDIHRAWISSPSRQIIGYGRGMTAADAIEHAATDAMSRPEHARCWSDDRAVKELKHIGIRRVS